MVISGSARWISPVGTVLFRRVTHSTVGVEKEQEHVTGGSEQDSGSLFVPQSGLHWPDSNYGYYSLYFGACFASMIVYA